MLANGCIMLDGIDQNPPPCVLIPVFNDWNALELLLPALDRVLSGHGLSAHVLVVDDSSTSPRPDPTGRGPFSALLKVTVLRLRRNLGHQRAIAVGLTYVYARTQYATVIVMDGDGEDSPEDVPRLLEEYVAKKKTGVVFAERLKRSESFFFRAGYASYRWLHRILVGQFVRVGNFSVVPRSVLSELVVVSELWNHYAAAVFRARLPYSTVSTTRARRLSGSSKMDVPALVIHGISAMSVYSETIGVRLLAVAFAFSMLAGLALVAVVALRIVTGVLLWYWAMAIGVLAMLFNALLLALVFTFITLLGRQNLSFIPARDYGWFVADTLDLYTGAGDSARR